MDNNYGSRIGKNSIIYMIKTVVGLLLPLITYPYVMRILSVESMGAINFANSIISYFSLLAMLGINTFAIRNGAKYRSSRSDFTKFASEIFTICSFLAKDGFSPITFGISYFLKSLNNSQLCSRGHFQHSKR